MPTPVSVPNTFVAGTSIVAAQANANFAALTTWINTNTVTTDGLVPFTGIPSGPAADPTTANQLARKAYVDGIIPVGMIAPYGGSAAPAGWLLCDGSAISRATYAALFTAIGTAYGIGNGTTTFNLPDFRGKFPVGRDPGVAIVDTLGETGGSRDAIAVTHSHTLGSHTHGFTTGVESANHQHSFTTNNPGDHSHGVGGGLNFAVLATTGISNFNPQSPASGATSYFHTAASGATTTPATDNSGGHTHSGNTGNVTANHQHSGTTGGPSGSSDPGGSSGTNANMPPFQVVNYIIRTNV
jgi:microcystin-dependent protein